METRTATPTTTQKDKITITKRNDYTVLIKFNTNYNNGIGYSRNPYNNLI